MENKRRSFIKKTVMGISAVSIGGVLPGFSAKSYGSILGANERLKVASMGVNSRGNAVGANFAMQPNCEVLYSCDVDTRASEKFINTIAKIQDKKPKHATDFRKALDDKDVDILIVAAPDHWHAPAAIMACKAGKHVYLEKPASHNPHEGELAVAAAKKYDRVVQMGNQRRSWPNVIAAIEELKQGIIGRPYFAKTWYANNRPSIGTGKTTEVPSWLDFDLWQGPAPREAFRDNIVHYNWHWFWNWGTGEALNNGTHFVDLARWGLGVDYPTRVSSNGGRYRYNDDWETPDTQVINLEFPNNTLMTWEGRSCNGRSVEGGGVGVMFYGENGSMVIEGGNSYKVYDLKNKLTKEVKGSRKIGTGNLSNPSQDLDVLHIQNLFNAIRKGTSLNSDITGGHKSTLLVQLGNIALRSGSTLDIDPGNGHILNNDEAMKYWRRNYAPGWEKVLS
ncbi:Gfo/Idh/MocA family protein [Sinomicrobium weinanense]|uniref:Gfo/Idh/MocA family oxidoreductase n=1 Tax=Sinomicrobium weinanense TaxID=2842200 RepID=A0A926JPR7_9FLAO|nr:Gfo/Idh/MocA family oxidoreductase [Sinomicrobium weinanense]MBC9795210.1 Gfo/Idh/MocA family oxidoreductase [Sinomicrobium weinanense]MBU3121987.1 Gfo/Idh/MocA family oxidoreductase [Sinomicrobium weinanense]